jgi:hypothetical protein
MREANSKSGRRRAAEDALIARWAGPHMRQFRNNDDKLDHRSSTVDRRTRDKTVPCPKDGARKEVVNGGWALSRMARTSTEKDTYP